MRRLLGILLTPIRLSRVGFVGTWLRLRAYSPSAFDGIATLLLSGPVYVIFRLFGVQPSGPEEEIALAATSAFVAFVLVSAIDFMLVGSLVRRVHSLAAAARGPARKTVLEFIDRHLRKLDQELKAMLSEEGAVLDVEDAAFWIEQSFLSGKGTTYNGTDSHLPSEYFELYPNYLEAHKTMLPPINAESASVDRGSRILIGAPDRFREDYFAHKDTSYSEFLGWHTEQRVALLQCDVDDAQRLKRDALDAIRRYATEPDGSQGLLRGMVHKLRKRTPVDPTAIPTLDMGLWSGRQVLLFRTDRSSGGERNRQVSPPKIRLWLRFVGDPWYEQCDWILQALRGTLVSDRPPVATPLKSAAPELFQRELCLRWEDFVDSHARMGTLGPFFENVLPPPNSGGAEGEVRTKVLDAAAGIGSDALWLQARGWDVTLNEIESAYREVIVRSFGMREYRLHDLDWRQLRSKLGDWFDVCLVVGNSLCLLSAPEALTQSIAQFYRVLKPGGMIVIDERNFRRIQRQAASGDQTPVRRFTHTGNVMYCGVRVQAFPRAVSGTEVYMGYYDMARVRRELYEREYWTDADWVSFEEAQIGSLHLYPFPGDGLGGLLDRAGFRDITVYNDLDYNEPVPWTDPLQLSASEAEFFTYTARKPHDAAPD